jgi:xylan 1,4-beta-xylosidase
VTLPGVPKPVFHAYRMMNALGDRLVARTDGGVVTRHSAGGRIAALAYHYPPEEPRSVPASFDTREVARATQSTGKPRWLELVVTGVRPGARFEVEVLDAGHGDAIEAWRRLGEPAEPSREVLATLDRMARATEVVPVVAGPDGEIRVERALSPWSLLLLRQLD